MVGAEEEGQPGVDQSGAEVRRGARFGSCQVTSLTFRPRLWCTNFHTHDNVIKTGRRNDESKDDFRSAATFHWSKWKVRQRQEQWLWSDSETHMMVFPIREKIRTVQIGQRSVSVR